MKALSRPRLFLLLVLALPALVPLTGCSQALSPLYRDYTVPPEAETEADLHDRIRAALEASGWEEAEPSAPGVITTRPRSVRNWGLYRIRVWLDVTPVGERYVRVLFHPYRYYVTGNRGMIVHLNRSLRRAVVDDLNRALAEQGLAVVGTPVARDREAVGR